MEKRVIELERKIGVVLEQLSVAIQATDNRYGLQGKLDIHDGYFESINKRIAQIESDLRGIKEPIEERVANEVETGLNQALDATSKVVGEVIEKRKRGRPKKVA